jgi:hypothetical protein
MTPRGTGLRESDTSIIALDKFIQATRDSGYKGTASAISELVDNSLQANAKSISITIEEGAEPRELVVSLVDDGAGMDPFTLRQALRFGGSSRFGDRSGLGRYGMGLPNASLSQARRVAVSTWQSTPAKSAPRVYSCYLDVDEIVRGELSEVPRPELLREAPPLCRGRSGTMVQWTRCDRLDNRRISTLERKHFIWSGTRLSINGAPVVAVDPLCVHPNSAVTGGILFGEELQLEVRVDADATTAGWVRVRFAELPVHDWFKLPNEKKRQLGISKGAGVSIVRGGREVDYGWFFMGGKRRENYDDWWRCEIQFDPILDEAFGITHTKQQVRPQPHLVEALSTDIEATARILNSRARKAHTLAKTTEHFSAAETVANARDHMLKPLPAQPGERARANARELTRAHPALNKKQATGEGGGGGAYRITQGSLRESTFFRAGYDGRRLLVVLNQDHPFYREIYRPLAEAEGSREQQLRAKLDLVLLAAARAEAALSKNGTAHSVLEQFLREWSGGIATFLND